RVAAPEADGRTASDHGIQMKVDFPGQMIVGLEADGLAIPVDEQVAIGDDVALGLEEAFGGVLMEQVAVDPVAVVRSGAFERPVTEQDVGASVFAAGGAGGFIEGVETDDGLLGRGGEAGPFGAGTLMLDLQVVAEGVFDAVALDQAGDERSAAVGIAEIHSGPGLADVVVADDPVPRRGLGGDAVEALRGVIAEDAQVFERDVVRVAAAPLGDHTMAARALAVQGQVAQGEVAGVDQADRDAAVAAQENRRVAGFRAGDEDRRGGGPVEA
ncbi:hypothetical protein RZS08_07295, partial [Arthrospira platensis SPKY1]|nr:hypothetical protein [Arthrospira platensis SPKY1]